MLEILAKRRSIRKYTKEKISEELIDSLIEAALSAASSKSRRPWEIVVVTDEHLLQGLAKAKAEGSDFLAKAPLAFIILGIPSQSDMCLEDTSLVGANIMVQATALGLGSCWIQIRGRFSEDGQPAEKVVKELIGAPKENAVESIIAVGYAAETKRPHRREDLHWEKVFRNRYPLSGKQA